MASTAIDVLILTDSHNSSPTVPREQGVFKELIPSKHQRWCCSEMIGRQLGCRSGTIPTTSERMDLSPWVCRYKRGEVYLHEQQTRSDPIERSFRLGSAYSKSPSLKTVIFLTLQPGRYYHTPYVLALEEHWFRAEATNYTRSLVGVIEKQDTDTDRTTKKGEVQNQAKTGPLATDLDYTMSSVVEHPMENRAPKLRITRTCYPYILKRVWQDVGAFTIKVFPYEWEPGSKQLFTLFFFALKALLI